MRVVTGRRRRGVAGAGRSESVGERADHVQRAPGRRVLRGLQVGIGLIVERVQFLGNRVVLVRGRGRRQVGVDRFLPEPDPGEGVRRHVERVRRVRRDLRVAPGRIERPRRQRRHVEAVNDVVRQTRMLRLPLELLLEDAGGLQLVRIGLVRRQRGLSQGQRVEDSRLDIVGMAAGQRLHRLFVRDGSCVR